MNQYLEVCKAKAGVTADELREVLKYGQDLVGADYLKRMNDTQLLGDVLFVAEIEGGVYLISYYLQGDNYTKATSPIKSIPSLAKYMERIEPIFDDESPPLPPVANSFWIDAVIKEQLG